MNRLLYTFACLCIATSPGAQQSYIDSIRQTAHLSQNDTTRMVLFRNLAGLYSESDADSAYHYAEVALQLARRLHFKVDEGSAMREMAYALLNKGNYPGSLQTVLASLAILENPESEKKVLVGKFPGDDELADHLADPHKQRLNEMAYAHQVLAFLYASSNDFEKALGHHLAAKQYAEQSDNILQQGVVNSTMGRVYLNLKKTDSALISEQNAYDLMMLKGYKKYLGTVLLNMGRIYEVMGKKDSAVHFYRRALETSRETYYVRGIAASNLLLADLQKQMGRPDSVLFFLRNALRAAHDLNAPALYLRSYSALADYFKSSGNNDSAVKYQSLIIRINDSLFNSRRVQEFQNIDFDERQRLSQIEEAKTVYRRKVGMYALVSGLAIFLFIAFILWRSSRQRKLANIQLSAQKKELESALQTLKTAQKHLVQSEKMASLGELTAGIAHEIQNPLNFVNNFSDVNKELLSEMKDEMDRGNFEDARAIANDIINNEGKISQHGKRADAIVKGMLQHSRTTTGQKEPTDINALCDEYIRLAYHGLRAKDKSFNTTIKTDFDNSLSADEAGIGKINIVPQDIGRVILNLINNAFFAVNEKAKLWSAAGGYEPQVDVTTKKSGGKIEIIVGDNGNGIPQNIIDKIFQPFFTTKPTGMGTGLGLSLAYDIIKAHGGMINVNTMEGKGTEFRITLPL